MKLQSLLFFVWELIVANDQGLEYLEAYCLGPREIDSNKIEGIALRGRTPHVVFTVVIKLVMFETAGP
jgi:hypothetical protein